MARRFSALVLPRWLSTFASNESFWPSLRELMPARSTALICTNTSVPPPSGAMKPKPLVALNHLTVPVAILLLQDAQMRGCHPHEPSRGLDPISAMSWGVEPVRRDQQANRLFEWAAYTLPRRRKQAKPSDMTKGS